MKKFIFLIMTGALTLLTVWGIGAGTATADFKPYDAIFVRFSGGTRPEIYRVNKPVTAEEDPFMASHHFNKLYENGYPG